MPFEFSGGKIGCVLIHGFTSSPWVLRPFGRALYKNGISVSAPLLPGHGTQPDEMIGVPWKTWIEAVKDATEKLNRTCEKLFLVGHSMGGAIALYLAAEMMLEGVVSLSAPIKLQSRGLRFIPVLKFFKKYWKKKSTRRHFPPGTEYDRYPLEAVLELKKLLAETERRLERIHVPALILHARGDRRVSEGNAEIIHRSIGSSEKKVILLNDPTHLIMLGEDQERVIQTVSQFIDFYSI